MKNKDFSKATKTLIIICIIIFTPVLMIREFQTVGDSYKSLGNKTLNHKHK